MQTVKRENKERMKKIAADEKPALDTITSRSNEYKEPELVDVEDVGIEFKIDRIETKMDSVYFKLNELNNQIQASLTLLLSASNIPQYQPIPLNDRVDFSLNGKKRRRDLDQQVQFVNQHSDRHLQEARMPPGIQLGNDMGVHHDNPPLMLDTDEMKVIQTIMDFDESTNGGDSVKEFETSHIHYENTKETMIEAGNVEAVPVAQNAPPATFVFATNGHEPANVEIVGNPTKENPQAKKWYTRKSFWITIAIICTCIIVGLILGIILTGRHKDEGSVEAPPPSKGGPSLRDRP